MGSEDSDAAAQPPVSAAHAGSHRSRRRRRASASRGEPAPSAVDASAGEDPARPAAAAEPDEPSRPRARRARGDGDRAERAMRDLVGAGPSQLGVSRALRGRDVDRPTEEDLAEAELDVVLVRRHWKPPAT